MKQRVDFLALYPTRNQKQICDRLGENTDGVDCSEYYQKTKDLLTQSAASCGLFCDGSFVCSSSMTN